MTSVEASTGPAHPADLAHRQRHHHDAGVYPDRHGVPVVNSYRVFDGSGHPSGSHPSFVYWTATDATDGKPVMVNENGKTAPWVAFTRVGCDFGAFSIANMEFETLPGDIGVVYGTTSPEFLSVRAALNLPNTPANAAARQKPNTDWLGIAIHCAQGSPRCAGGKPDLLPEEPGPQTRPHSTANRCATSGRTCWPLAPRR